MTRRYPERQQICPTCTKQFTSTFRDRPAPYGKCWKTYCSYRCNFLKNAPRGENHPQWKGDNVGYKPLHEWVRKHSTIPKACEDCGQEKRLEAANVSGEYKRDLSDWRFLCSSCHDKMDGIGDKRTAKGQFSPKESRNSFIPYPAAYLRRKSLNTA